MVRRRLFSYISMADSSYVLSSHIENLTNMCADRRGQIQFCPILASQRCNRSEMDLRKP